MAAIDLCTEADVKTAIQLPAGDTDLDTLIPGLITDASRAIHNHCKREFVSELTGGTGTRRFRVDGFRVDFTPWDLQSASAVVLHPEDATAKTTLTAVTDYQLKPINPERGVYQSIQLSGFLVVVSQTLIRFGYALMDVTGTWGFPSVPEDVNRACVITVGAWLTRTAPAASSAYGIPAADAAGATTFRSDWHLPWAAVKLLSPYKRGSARWSI